MTAALHPIRAIPLAELHESPANPRQRFDAGQLQELAANLTTAGQITPLLVRPRKSGGYEIAAGHRRLRAARLAKLPALVAIVREDWADNDPAFLEALNVENLQRDDLHPLEEAAGFKALLEQAGYDIARLAHRVGRSERYVYDRLGLLKLTKEAKSLFLAGAFPLTHAVLLSQLAPSDQARAIASERSGNGRIGGLFEHDALTEQEELSDELADGPPRKPVSLNEFKQWIRDHVRFDPETVDLPVLFPETEQALAGAAREELKVVKITRDWLVGDEARDPKERTYGAGAWRRADGEKAEPQRYDGRKAGKPATCDHAVLGVVVAGPGRGEAFLVCLEKKKCTVHWGPEIRKAKQSAKTGGGASAAAREREREVREKARWQREAEERKVWEARWTKALPAVTQAVLEALDKAPAGVGSAAARIALHRDLGPQKVGLTGTDAAAVVRAIAFSRVGIERHLWIGRLPELRKELKALGVDLDAVINRAAPVEPKAAEGSTPAKAPARKKAGRKAAAR